ncbi:RsbR, positive regulator of sigma-B [Labilithrix luteola]|uniref:RsbR, positive regulator of sigma-B n=1 Tax=Labilithrix luteola TaxID=1391654 RepID=A0A0K1PJB5_9BACT|nr:STAS domain-containing protein [Labilithrix luteola]AKU93615.1 RsbR, positive regulator of sigma-B [Labilithrix luteola]
MSEPTEDLTERMLVRITDMLLLVADVALGDYTRRLEIDLPEGDPIAILYDGINSMVKSLEVEQGRSSAYQKELEEKLAMIETQRVAIKELSTPIIELWKGVLCLPVVGVLDSTRSAEMTEQLLNAIVDKKARCAIIDITGIQVMDTATADHFLRMTKSVRLLGARCLLTGVNPSIAQTVVHMGVDLSGLDVHRSLRVALERFMTSEFSVQ